MAFNFNWSPLIADTDRVRDMLTRSLNKSPKPPIIVDDIIVNELNLGSTPPELEILEVGDLAEDKFRGIFKMSYTGDAYLTLKTRVQANPLNTYLSNKPSFASPQPLAASSGLTIPLQITLSDIRLSGFVILVFSKQKGITLVFRNDPLESLKVSSTFDSIPFVRDYLQKTIESQLRVLFMEDLPAIIHRLSLQMFSTEYQGTEAQEPAKDQSGQRAPMDPFASPAQQATDSFGQPLESSATFSLDAPTETYASFSQKNLLRLAALTESQRTLSLFTPSMRDTVYRAWASAADRNELSNGRNTPLHRPTLSRIQSTVGSHSAWSSSAPSQASETPSANTRPGLARFPSAPTVYSLASSAPRSRAGRKRKNRIINLRKEKVEGDVSDVASVSSGYPESADCSATGSTAPSVEAEPTMYPSARVREGEISTPPRSPRKKVGFQQASEPTRLSAERASARRPVTPRNTAPLQVEDDDQTPRASMYLPKDRNQTPKVEPRPPRQRLTRMQTLPTRDKPPELPRRASDLSIHSLGAASSGSEGSTGGILEQAWMMRMANEIARKVAEEKGRRPTWQTGGDEREVPPPAYVS
ncbi:ERMES complex subunit [Friedmanniomyces endolithicus]|uniref:Mitochondrial distribution and morphology protein 34 n=1 Tax=Friedmanniomyces endolithicus TaxID=329885 RepID=A0AAN6FCN4_9PEZI|nr:ERMES complex subunit [Friedmanniomyces endolithicus]KAK0295016.1 ERMES complex subunit [Friedmanniomyces endolithicus]KAK0310171.1 ERMES complex subunit [Friedmanniomyces endolithicus]KAK0990668.1 ERMES complex subunit [Friedmanniomyces endolithicus]